MRAEMARQHGDALATLGDDTGAAATIAAAIRAAGGVRLVGMGASHGAGRTAAVVLRRAGLDAVAVTASEALQSPLPATLPRLLVSQSGESGEIAALLDRRCHAPTFGLTLTPASRLAHEVPCLVGAGGPEHGFAATRSLAVTLAGFARIGAALGIDAAPVEAVLRAPLSADVAPLVPALVGRRSVVVVGHGALTGLAEVVALHLMELARIPALAMDAGQFRHGPVELLGPDLAMLQLRAAEEGRGSLVRLAAVAAAAGAAPAVLDAGGAAGEVGALGVALPAQAEIAAALSMLPTLQELVIAVAARSVDRVGEPRHARKVVREL
jgi:fructoselysine-6-P-deglycase FrlB-like protein